MTDQSPEADPLPRQDPTADEASLPRQKPPTFGDPGPGAGGASLFERPQRGAAPVGHESLPQRGQPLPPGDALPPLPPRGEPLPQRPDSLPQRLDSLSQRGDSLPQRGEPLPQRGGGNGLPQRGGPGGPPQNGGSLLPRRTGRSRPAGRHRSPHRLSVASDAPALIIAVPGSAAGQHVAAVEEIAAVTESSCPGVEIRVGFADGDAHGLAENLAFDAPPTGDRPLNGVLVPLLAGPHPVLDMAFGRAVDGTSGDVMLGAHLGPHPLIAEALHARLAEAGLARETRSRGLSISHSNFGVLVLADRGEESVQSAGVAAVLLASRLTLPTAHASIDDPAGIDAALARLREAGAARPIIAPCVIGPETAQRDLDTVSNAIGAPCAAPLGAHPAIGQLVAIRYGAALTRLSMAAG